VNNLKLSQIPITKLAEEGIVRDNMMIANLEDVGMVHNLRSKMPILTKISVTKNTKSLLLHMINHTSKGKNNSILKKVAMVEDRDKVASNYIIRKRILLVETQVAGIINKKMILTILLNRATRKRNIQRVAEVEVLKVVINSNKTIVKISNNTHKNNNIHRKKVSLKMRFPAARRKLKSLKERLNLARSLERHLRVIFRKKQIPNKQVKRSQLFTIVSMHSMNELSYSVFTCMYNECTFLIYSSEKKIYHYI
jgi:hypothetical protein